MVEIWLPPFAVSSIYLLKNMQLGMTTMNKKNIAILIARGLFTFTVCWLCACSTQVDIKDKGRYLPYLKTTKKVNSWLSVSGEIEHTNGRGKSILESNQHIDISDLDINGPANLTHKISFDGVNLMAEFQVLNTDLATMKILSGFQTTRLDYLVDDSFNQYSQTSQSVVGTGGLVANFPISERFSFTADIRSGVSINGDLAILHKYKAGFLYRLSDSIELGIQGFKWEYDNDEFHSPINIELSGLAYGLEIKL